ncbi:MAG: NUDIX hydrolase [Sedimentitalea sp.]
MFGPMIGLWKSLRTRVLGPARRAQVAAICYRDTDQGRDVLLITSRDTGRWIVPKGWPIKGLNNADAALREAWEEAGVSQATVEEKPLGTFDYDKGLQSGKVAPVRAQVFVARVLGLSKTFPEAGQRQRKWVSPKDAAKMVREPELKALLRAF